MGKFFILPLVTILMTYFYSGSLTFANGVHDLFSIQVGAYRDLGFAEKETKKMELKGYDAFFRHEEIRDSGKWYRVYVGRYESKGVASQEAKRLTELGLIQRYYVRALGKEENIPRISAKDRQEGEGSRDMGAKPDDQGKDILDMQEKVGSRPGPPIVIKDVTFSKAEGGREILSLHVDRHPLPSILFSLNGEKPRLTVEVAHAVTPDKKISGIRADGTWVTQIRMEEAQGKGGVVIVCELRASKKYEVRQVFHKDKGIYAIEVTAVDKV